MIGRALLLLAVLLLMPAVCSADMSADDGAGFDAPYANDGSAGGPWDSQAVYAAIEAASARHGLSSGFMVRVAMCESTMNPHAVNRLSGARGLYQLLSPGKLDAFYRAGFTDWRSARQQAEFFAAQVVARQMGAWVCR